MSNRLGSTKPLLVPRERCMLGTERVRHEETAGHMARLVFVYAAHLSFTRERIPRRGCTCEACQSRARAMRQRPAPPGPAVPEEGYCWLCHGSRSAKSRIMVARYVIC